ncbi:MAG: two-component system sensor histidine kinase/response regulator [Caulobacteraceae bacterium]|nr:two-component system sensor histidine kinase/response regulator [Caulobacteraceae bacterium]
MAYGSTEPDREAELPLRLALDAAAVGVWEYDVQARKMTWDHRVREGAEVDADFEPSWEAGFLAILHPDDRPAVIEAFRSLVAAGVGGSLAIECRLVGRQTGRVMWTALAARGVAASDGGLRVVGSARNITAQRLATDELRRVNERLEERVAEVVAERQVFADMFESSDDQVAAVDGELRFIAMNAAYAKAFRRLFGAPPRVGDKLADALAHMPAARDAAVSVWTRAVNGEVVDVPRSGEADPNGAWYDIKFRPLRDRKGRLVGAFQYSRDVTQRVRASQRMREAQEAIQRAQKMEALGQLTGGVAHDFNNLLQVIGGNLQLLKRETAGDERAERRIDYALAAVTRGAKLASQLLAFGRRQPLEPRVVNLGRFLHGMDDMLRRALGAEIELETVVSGGLWNTLVDPGQIENAILNLAINGRDAMEGRGLLTLEAGNGVLDEGYARQHAEVTPGQYVMVAVTDTGSGMTPEVMARAFDPFFSTKPEGKGTGLGLSMVYGLVKQSGGHVKIYSEVGQGTTVKLYLPRVLQNEEELPDASGAPVAGGAETILVVEDDLEVRETAVALLADLGYRVLKAHDAAAGLAVIESGATVDLLFTDVVMPGAMRSADLARKAQELIPGLPVLFTSGYTENAIVHGGRLDAGVELLAKPYTREALARKIRQLLPTRRQDSPSAPQDR